MKVTVVGCAGSYPSQNSPASCYLIEHGDTAIVLDLGNGSLGALAKYIELEALDAVVISHLHPDHCADLGSYYVRRRYHPDGPAPQLPVFGPTGIAARAAAMYGLDADPGMTAEFAFTDFSEGFKATIGEITIETFAVYHCIESYALRVSAGGRTLTYSGDTAPCDGLVEASVGADVALFEAAYLESGENSPGIHMTGKEAADAAVSAGVNRLVLTHLVSWYDPSDILADASDFPGDVQLAYPGQVIDI